MRLKLLLTALLVALPAQAAQAAQIVRGPDQIQYSLDLDYSEPHVLRGTQTIRFHNPFATPMSKVWLRLWANGLGGCRDKRILVQPVQGATMDPLAVGCTTVGMNLLQPVPAGGSSQIKIFFRASTPDLEDRFGRAHGIDFWGNALPVLAVRDEQGWHVREPYSDVGESFYHLSSSWQVQIKAPRGMQLATSGTGQIVSGSGSNAVWQFSTPAARDFMIAGGKMAMTQVWQDGIRIRLWSHPSFFRSMSKQQLSTLQSKAKRALQMFNKWFGYYNKQELDIILLIGVANMEFSDLAMTSPDEETVAHEIAHQWWYSMLGNNQYATPWVDESFAEYSAVRFSYELYRNTDYAFEVCPRGWDERFRTSTIALNADMGLWEKRPKDYSSTVYDEGACRVMDLTRQMGEVATNRFFHDLVQRYRDGIVTQEDIIATIRRWAPPGVDVDAWLQKSRIQIP